MTVDRSERDFAERYCTHSLALYDALAYKRPTSIVGIETHISSLANVLEYTTYNGKYGLPTYEEYKVNRKDGNIFHEQTECSFCHEKLHSRGCKNTWDKRHDCYDFYNQLKCPDKQCRDLAKFMGVDVSAWDNLGVASPKDIKSNWHKACAHLKIPQAKMKRLLRDTSEDALTLLTAEMLRITAWEKQKE